MFGNQVDSIDWSCITSCMGTLLLQKFQSLKKLNGNRQQGMKTKRKKTDLSWKLKKEKAMHVVKDENEGLVWL